ncbi:MAG: hypothetical protein ABIH65_02540 [Nanoarchaeota archaeon]
MRQDAHRKKIIEYLQKNLKKGYTIESLRWALVGQGYSRTAVELAINELNKELARKAPILSEEPIIRHEIIGENNQPIVLKKPWWKRIFG